MPGGRPTKYKPEYVEQVKRLCENGATVSEIAHFFQVNIDSLYEWGNVHPEFSEAIKIGREVSDNRVEMSLYRKAIGYSFESEKIFQYEGEVIRAPYTEQVQADTASAIFWLKNRRPKDWRDRIENATTLTIAAPLDRPPIETRDEWLQRRLIELGVQSTAPRQVIIDGRAEPSESGSLVPTARAANGRYNR